MGEAKSDMPGFCTEVSACYYSDRILVVGKKFSFQTIAWKKINQET
jgi:hypothetical protein